MTLAITGIYASVLGIMLIGLTAMVGIKRGQTGISIFHGDNLDLGVRIRQQANFIEQVPTALILMSIAEIQGAPSAWMHTAGAILLVSRVIHPFGILADKPATIPRAAGTLGTQICMAICIYLILWPVIVG